MLDIEGLPPNVRRHQRGDALLDFIDRYRGY